MASNAGDCVVLEASGEVIAALRDVHAAGTTTRLTLPLPDGRSIALQLRTSEVWEAGGTAIVVDENGDEHRLAPAVSLFAGHVPGLASRAFLGVSAEFVHGYVTLEGETFYLSSGPARNAPQPLRASAAGAVRFTVAPAASFAGLPTPDWCRTPGPLPARQELRATPGSTQASGSEEPLVRDTLVFVEVDRLLREVFDTDQAALDYATLIVAVANDVYRRDLGVLMTLPDGYLRIWNVDPPWGSGLDPDMQVWWPSAANPLRELPRAQVHLFSHVPLGGQGGLYFGGFAANLLMCRMERAFGWSSMRGFFPTPFQHAHANNGDPLLFMHQSGHIYGAQHAPSYGVECGDGSGPDVGTIMGLACAGNNLAGIGARFHAVVQGALRTFIEAQDCPVPIPFQRGDYTLDGVIDVADLVEFEAYAAQGFASQGALEAFDMDADGIVDKDDLELFLVAMLPPASALGFNGSGRNCRCYRSVKQPVLGRAWVAQVESSPDDAVLTAIVGSTRRIDALQTPLGELLIALAAQGGTRLFTLFETAENGTATYTIELPDDASLAGRTLETQALVFRPGGIELLNGVSLTLSTYY